LVLVLENELLGLKGNDGAQTVLRHVLIQLTVPFFASYEESRNTWQDSVAPKDISCKFVV
jgi:hypothetical protein